MIRKLDISCSDGYLLVRTIEGMNPSKNDYM